MSALSWTRRKSSWELFALALILGVALILRLWNLETLPPGLYHDEAYNGLDALSLIQGKEFPQTYEGWELYVLDAHSERPAKPTKWPIFFEGNYGREPLHVYLMAISISWLGATSLALRLVPALSGVLAVFGTYLAAKTLFAREGVELEHAHESPASRWAKSPATKALVASFLLSVFFPALHFSRFGIRAMLMLPLQTLAVYFFWRGRRRLAKNHGPGSRSVNLDFCMAGFFSGLAIYTYLPARLFPLVFVLFLAIRFWRKPDDRRLLLRSALFLFGTMLVIIGPLLLFMIRYPFFLTFRIAFVANRGEGAIENRPWLTWLLNVYRVALGLLWSGETTLRHNLPGRPFLDLIQATAFLAGLAAIARNRIKSWRYQFLAMWLVVMLLPSILSGDAPHFGRMIGAAPPVAMVAAVGLTSIINWLGRLQMRRRVLQAGLIGILLISLVVTSRDYFFNYANHSQLRAHFHQDDWRLGQYAASRDRNTTLYLSPTQEDMATIYFALGGAESLSSFNGENGALPLGRPGNPALYLVRPSATKSLARLRSHFENSSLDDSNEEFLALHVPEVGDGLVNSPSQHVSFDGNISLVDWRVTHEGRLIVEMVWQAGKTMERDYTAFVHLLDSNGRLVAQTDRQPAGYPTSDWRRRELVRDAYVVQLPSDLRPGTYTLTTGFYYLPSMERLGTAAVLTELELN